MSASARKNSSVLWHHFEKDNNTLKGTCNRCKEALSYKSSTANLKSHLRRKHPAVYLSVFGADDDQSSSGHREQTWTQTLHADPASCSSWESSDSVPGSSSSSAGNQRPLDFGHTYPVSSVAMKIGFIGGGRLAFALANGFISAGLAKPDEITASCHPADTASADAFKGLGATTFFENKPVVERSEVVIVSTKPDVVVPALREVSSDPAVKNKLFISVAMGISIATIEKVLPPESRVIRVMPNTPALVQQGAAALSRGSRATAEDAKLVTQLFSAVGTCDEVPEYQMDAVTALSGSGPAYIFMLIESLAEGGVRCGLPRDLALRLASQTTLGSAAMVKNGGHPATLKDNVTSPAGSTAAGTYYLEKSGFRAAVIGAVAAAADRCKVVNEKLNI